MAATAMKKQDCHRKALLAKVHIAPIQLGISDEDRRDIIEGIGGRGKRSSRQLNNRQLNILYQYFLSKGYKPKVAKSRSQSDALKIRARGLLDKAVAHGLVNSASGLVKKICEVDDLSWCKDAGKLKRLLAVLDSITENGQTHRSAPTEGTHAV